MTDGPTNRDWRSGLPRQARRDTVTVTVAGVSLTPGLGLGLVAVYAAIVVDFYV
ncbi:hypothetical protein [Halosimplex salinum]|uniref:hypothetical protein n=1 Tax=Halosimplex salinum TaxID=1710538 RepID=UPI0019CF5D6F|nr:hypothetical protein [Halosimplex salinum]